MNDLAAAIALYRNRAFVVLEASPELMVIVEAAEERLAQLESECEHCDECGRAYCDVYDLPDALWALIHERAPAGLLCPTCALRRLGALRLAQFPEPCERCGELAAQTDLSLSNSSDKTPGQGSSDHLPQPERSSTSVMSAPSSLPGDFGELKPTHIAYGYLPPMTALCLIGACSRVGPCNNDLCGCTCHLDVLSARSSLPGEK